MSRQTLRWTRLLGLLIFTALLGPGLPLAAPAAPTQAAQVADRVRVGVLFVSAEATIFIGVDQGYYRELGLDLELTPSDPALGVIPLGTGQIDVTTGGASASFLNAVARGVDVKLVADGASAQPGTGGQALMFRRELVDSGLLRTPADLRGRRVAVTARGSGGEIIIARWLQMGGLRLDDVDVVQLSFPDQLPAFASGAIDASTLPDPFQTFALEQGLATAYGRLPDLYPGYQIGAVNYGAAFARQQADAARRFMLAYMRGVRDYNDAFFRGDAAKRRMAIDSLVRHTPIKDPALYERMLMIGVRPDGRLNLTSMAEDQEYYLANGWTQSRVDLNALIDYSFLDAALQVLGPYE